MHSGCFPSIPETSSPGRVPSQAMITQPTSNIIQTPLVSVSTQALVPISIASSQFPPSHPAQASDGFRGRDVTSQQLPRSDLLIPDIPLQHLDGTRSPKCDSWREIVEHWQNGDPPRGLHTPLKDWPLDWLRGPNKIFAMKHHHRAVIAKEFLNVSVSILDRLYYGLITSSCSYGSNEAAFILAYPEAEGGHSKLLVAIDKARRARGDVVTRKRA